jgi:Uri superfamily endonuclease
MRRRSIAVERSGRVFEVDRGWYGYVGSALGPGGLTARLRRHAAAEKRRHWHVDSLLEVGSLTGALTAAGERRLECSWARWTARRAIAVIDGFGASDCRCAGHLFVLGSRAQCDAVLASAAADLGGTYLPVSELRTGSGYDSVSS